MEAYSEAILAIGDENTSYFYNYALGWRKHNQVDMLKDSNGDWQENQKKIFQVIVKYFSKLFQASVEAGGLSGRKGRR